MQPDAITCDTSEKVPCNLSILVPESDDQAAPGEARGPGQRAEVLTGQWEKLDGVAASRKRMGLLKGPGLAEGRLGARVGVRAWPGPQVSAPRLLCGRGPPARSPQEQLLCDCGKPEPGDALCPELGHLELGHLEPGHLHRQRPRPPECRAGSCRGQADHCTVPRPGLRALAPRSTEAEPPGGPRLPTPWGFQDGLRPGNAGDEVGARGPGPLWAKNLTRRTARSLPFAGRLHCGRGMKWQWPNPPPPSRPPRPSTPGGRGEEVGEEVCKERPRGMGVPEGPQQQETPECGPQAHQPPTKVRPHRGPSEATRLRVPGLHSLEAQAPAGDSGLG